MENEENEELSIPIFFSVEEIQHVNYALKIYRKTIAALPQGNLTLHALAVIDRAMNELVQKNDELAVEQARAALPKGDPS